MKVSVLASGSGGNATLVSDGESTVLVDVGISPRRISKLMQPFGLSIDDIGALFITHSHTDHFAGLESFAKRRNVPVFASEETASSIDLAIGAKLEKTGISIDWNYVENGSNFIYSKMSITSFEVPHDANGAMAFTFENANSKLGIATDLGFVTNSVKFHLKDCTALVIEMNHDPDMLRNSNRPEILKSRIFSKLGHLSNEQAVEFLEECDMERLRLLFPAHLSSECNDFSCVMSAILSSGKCRNVQVIQTYQDKATDFIDITCK